MSLGGTLQGQPSAVTTATGMMVLFRGAHGGRLHYVAASGGNWSAVQELQMGPLGTAPRAVSTDSGNVYVFWRGVNPHQLWSAHYAPASGWRGPALLASGLDSQPSPAVSGAETVNVFWKGEDGRLWHMSRGLSHPWRAPSALAMGEIGAAPHAAGQRGGEIDVFWGGATPGTIWRGTYSSNGGWGTPQRAGSGMDGQLIVVGSTPSTESAFWKGRGGLLWRSTSQGAGWGPAAAMPLGAIGTKLAAVGQSNGVVDVFWRALAITCGIPASIRRPRRGRVRAISGGACADALVAGRALRSASRPRAGQLAGRRPCGRVGDPAAGPATAWWRPGLPSSHGGSPYVTICGELPGRRSVHGPLAHVRTMALPWESQAFVYRLRGG